MNRNELLERILYQWPIKILSLCAAILLFFFTNLVDLRSNYVTLPVRYIMPTGLVASETYSSRVRLHLRGSGSSIEGISENDLQVTADFSFVQSPGTYQVPLQVSTLSAGTSFDDLEIDVEPASIKLRLETIAYKEVPIKVIFAGEPKTGYEVHDYSVNPSTIRLSGPESRIAEISSIQTEEIQLAARSNGFSQRIRVQSPSSLLSISGLDDVELNVDIREAQVPYFLNGLVPELRNLNPDLYGKVSGELRAEIKINYSDSLKFDTHTVKAYIDCSSVVNPGNFLLPVALELPIPYELESLQPSVFELEINSFTEKEGAEASDKALPEATQNPGSRRLAPSSPAGS